MSFLGTSAAALYPGYARDIDNIYIESYKFLIIAYVYVTWLVRKSLFSHGLPETIYMYL